MADLVIWRYLGFTSLIALLGTGFGPCASGQTRVSEASPLTTKLNIVIEEGEGATNNIKARTARAPVVRVEDENHRPVAGATVAFSLPARGAGGTFVRGGKMLKISDRCKWPRECRDQTKPCAGRLQDQRIGIPSRPTTRNSNSDPDQCPRNYCGQFGRCRRRHWFEHRRRRCRCRWDRRNQYSRGDWSWHYGRCDRCSRSQRCGCSRSGRGRRCSGRRRRGSRWRSRSRCGRGRGVRCDDRRDRRRGCCRGRGGSEGRHRRWQHRKHQYDSAPSEWDHQRARHPGVRPGCCNSNVFTVPIYRNRRPTEHHCGAASTFRTARRVN